MLYVKSKEGKLILEDYKIFGECPRCNTDVPINLSSLLKNEDTNLYNVEVFL